MHLPNLRCHLYILAEISRCVLCRPFLPGTFSGVLIKKKDHLFFSLHCFARAYDSLHQHLFSQSQARNSPQGQTSLQSAYPKSQARTHAIHLSSNPSQTPVNLTKAHSFGGQHSQDGASPATAAKYLFPSAPPHLIPQELTNHATKP